MFNTAGPGKLLLILFCAALSIISFTATGQQPKKDSIIAIFRKIQQQYQEAGNLYCQLKYRYATQSAPSITLDSLPGNMLLSGTNFRMEISNTETIKTDHYRIMLFKKDKLMCVSRADAALRQQLSPIEMLDSLLNKNQNISWNISMTGNSEVVSLLFPDGMSCKKMDLTIDLFSGYISKVSYLVPTEQLLDKAVTPRETNAAYTDQYAIVEVTYSDYHIETNAGKTAFKEQDYFLLRDHRLLPAENYKDYKIIAGSPNL